MFFPKNMEVDDELIEVGSIYYHENWRESIKPFVQAVFNPGVFVDSNGLEEMLQSYKRPFELNDCIFKLLKTSFIFMQTKDNIKQWVNIPEDVTKKLRDISDIYSRNI